MCGGGRGRKGERESECVNVRGRKINRDRDSIRERQRVRESKREIGQKRYVGEVSVVWCGVTAGNGRESGREWWEKQTVRGVMWWGKGGRPKNPAHVHTARARPRTLTQEHATQSLRSAIF